MKIAKRMMRIAAALLMVALAVAAHATEGVVVGDTYVNSAQPGVNYGGLSNLYVNSTGTTLIQFDLSSLPAGTTASQVGAAFLKIYVNRINTSGLVSVQPITGSWNESAVTYSTYSSSLTLGSTAASFTPATAQQFIVVDITSLVQSWLNGTPNNGIALTTSSADVVFDSKENDETSHAAHLDITVVSQGSAGTPGTAATVSVGTTTTGAAGTNASVTNSGTSSAAVLNFTIPTGATGPTGPTGPPGPPGSYGTGAAPTGIPLSSGGNSGSSVYMRLGGGAESNTLNGLVTTYTDGNCLLKLRIQSFTGVAETWVIVAVTPVANASWNVEGYFPELDCDTAAALGSTCTVNTSYGFGQAYYLTLSDINLSAAGGGGIMQSFSCEP